MVGKGEFILEYKREYVAPESKWRNKFNYAITIYGSLVLYTIYFFVFEGKNVLGWCRRKLQSNPGQIQQKSVLSSDDNN